MSSNVRSVTFSGGYALGICLRGEVRDQMGMHNLTILDFPLSTSKTSRIPPEKTPVTFKWGNNVSAMRTFVGYVNHSETIDTNDLSILRVFVIGASLPFDDPEPRSWGRVSGSYVVSAVGKSHGFRVITHKSSDIIPSWAQGNESDFKMLKRLEDRTGYHFWFDGTTVYFLDPNRLVLAPGLTNVKTYAQNISGTNTLFSFNSLSGSLTPDSNNPTVKSVYGMSATGRPIKATSAKTIADLRLDTPARASISLESADTLLEARNMSNSQIGKADWVEATANIVGDSSVRVGSVVRLDGNMLATGNSGLWLVKGTTNVSDQSLYTSLLLTRNAKKGLTYTTNSSLNDPARGSSVIRGNGNWESRSLGTIYV